MSHFRMILRATLATIFAAVLAGPGPAHAQTLDKRFPVTDGWPYAMSVHGNTLFVGGNFGSFMPVTGPFAVLDGVTGNRQPNWPAVDAPVRAIVADGAGGFFIGGDFTKVGGITRAHLAHLRIDGSLDAWNPGADQAVQSLTLDGTTLYVGGLFTKVGGLTRGRLAAVDAFTGAVTPWDPEADDNVYAIQPAFGKVYIAGEFLNVGGVQRLRLAALDAATGQPTAWDPESNGPVRALLLAGNTLYAGGTFSSIMGQSRQWLAAIRVPEDTLLSANTTLNGDVYGICALGSRLYVCGGFSLFLNSPPAYHSGVAAVDPATLAVIPSWIPPSNPFNTLGVSSIIADHGAIYVSNVLGSISACDTLTGALLPFRASTNGPVTVLAASDGRIAAGGTFQALGGAACRDLAAIDIRSGAVLPWTTATNLPVRALAWYGDTLVIGGDFYEVAGQPRDGIALIDATTGALKPFSVSLFGLSHRVNALAVSGDTLYVGGEFTGVSGIVRRGLAALSLRDGALLPWQPGGFWDRTVNSLAVHRGDIIVGGPSYLTAVDRATGAISSWAPASGYVYSLLLSGNTVFVNNGGGASAFDVTTGLIPASWAPGASGVGLLASIAMSDAGLVVGGFGAQALDPVTGKARTWKVKTDDTVTALAASGSQVFLGGYFTKAQNTYHPGFAAVFTGTTDVTPAPAVGASIDFAPPAPDPVRTRATLTFTLPHAGRVHLTLHDVQGRVVATLADGLREAGEHHVTLESGALRGGLYFARLTTSDGTRTQRIAVVH
jgi:hypothetical protein